MDAMRYSSLGGGKRLRPFLVVESSAVFGVPREAALLAGAALECIHCYSLIHDDLPAMDNSDLRRGRPTLHKKTDDATAILAGDGLLTLAFDIVTRDEIHRDANVRLLLTRALARASGIGGMVGGQMLDLAGEGRFGDREPVDVARLQQMKTGALLRYRLHRRRDPRPVLAGRIPGARRLRPRARRGVPDRRRPARRRRRRGSARQADRTGRSARQDHLRHPARHRRRQAARARSARARRFRAVGVRRQGRRAARRRALRRRTQELTASRMTGKEAEDALLAPLPEDVQAGPRGLRAAAHLHLDRDWASIAFFLLPVSLRLVTRMLVGWDIFVALYLLLVLIMMVRCGLAHIKRNAILQDDGRFLILLVVAFGAFASIAAIVFELGASHHSVPRTGAGDRHHRAVMGRGAYRVRAALRP